MQVHSNIWVLAAILIQNTTNYKFLEHLQKEVFNDFNVKTAKNQHENHKYPYVS